MKNLNKKILSSSVSAGMTLAICSSIPVGFASDIEIYSDSQKGKTSILLMLDTSGSMGISSLVLPNNNTLGSPGDVEPRYANTTTPMCSRVDVDEGGVFKQWAYNAIDRREGSATRGRTSFKKTVTINGQTIPYYLRGCGTATLDANGNMVESETGKFDRLSRLKEALIQLLADTNPNTSIDDTVAIGLGNFSAKTPLNVGTTTNKLVDGHSGRIITPVAALTASQREVLIRELAKIVSVDTTTNEDGTSNGNLKLSSTNYPDITKASSGTPTAHAYAEAAAYMMGTTTGQDTSLPSNATILYDGYSVMQKTNDSTKQVYYMCVSLGTERPSALGATVMACDNAWNTTDGAWYNSASKRMGDGIKIYKPNGTGGWIPVTARELQSYVGDMNEIWETHAKLPAGWRYGGWMKLDHEPMDIEPIGGKVWSNRGASNLVSYRTSPFSIKASGEDNLYGGFAYSNASTKNGNNYKAGGSTNQCDGNGIYFLTDGSPNSTKNTMAQAIMNRTLGNTYAFSTIPNGGLASPLVQSSVFTNETGGWEYIGAYAKKIKDKTQNPSNMMIKTAVVGFGSSFAGIPKNSDGTYNCEAIRSTNLNAYNACKWGGAEYGEGGFYFAENSSDIKRSIIEFVKKTEVNIEPVVTGNPVIPIDALNPTELKTDAYYATFEPKVSSATQLWVGNLNKYSIKNGELFSANGGARLINTNGSLNAAALGFWTGGTLGQLSAGADFSTFATDGKIVTNRKVYTNRKMTGAAASFGNELQVVDVDALIGGHFNQDGDKNYWLNVLGFNIDSTQANITKTNLQSYATERKLGAVMHSTPVLLTQEGKVSSSGGVLTTSERKDYLMYGSTQGVLHVVDVKTGKEVFGFLPHEMMVNQKSALLLNDKTIGGASNLFYGIDAPWVAHTQYTTTSSGLLTVKGSDRAVDENEGSDLLTGHQWVYGGLRMGGKSFYALDLSDINAPKMMFHINPTATNSSQPLKRMGQSWSKPTLAQVNWGGQRKLVMFVGGGYDAEGQVTCGLNGPSNKGYECPTYMQTNKIGAGVYMFDAKNGELLWWSSVDNNGTPADSTIRFTANSDLKYSVVSQINAIDRNSDGLVDHLYFGDLAGQTFRVDLNNALQVSQTLTEQNAKDNFATRTVTLFSEHNAAGKSPRFYEMPSFSVHVSESTGQRFGAVAFSSGNRSTPLANENNSAKDGVFVVYDNDVASRDLYSATYVLKTTKVNALQETALTTPIAHRVGDSYTAGWKHFFSDRQGVYKGMNNLYALDGMLYVNVYHKDGNGIAGNCGGGVKGDSYLFQYCLPYGKCGFEVASSQNGVNRVRLGAGLIGTGVGKGYGNKSNTISLVVNRDNPSTLDCQLPANKNRPECQLFDNSVRLKQLRWYESR